MNTGVGSLSLLQGIFSTQELNRSLLDGRWIIYQLSQYNKPIFDYIVNITYYSFSPSHFTHSTYRKIKYIGKLHFF